MRNCDFIAAVLPKDGALMKTRAIHEAVTKLGCTTSLGALSQTLMKNAQFTSVQRGWWRLAQVSPAASSPTPAPEPVAAPPPPGREEIRERVLNDMEERWIDSTAGVRDEGQMPPEIAAVLFGRSDPYAPPAGTPILKSPGLSQAAAPSRPAPLADVAGPRELAAFRATTAGESKRLAALAWLLSSINAQIMSLKQLRGVDLEEVSVHPVDLARLKSMAQAGADGLSHFEALLTTAAEAHF